MGGLAFSSGQERLDTPRMPTAIYQQVLNSCHAKLRQLFVITATPIPGPAKQDHGDIDILVAWERNAIFPSSTSSSLSTSIPTRPKDSLEAAKHLLNAKHSVRQQSGSINLAIPWPETGGHGRESHDDSGSKRYIQVDLHLCKSLEQLQWLLFKNAHGDIWNVLGSLIRPFGLTIDEVGLHIRIPEIEALDRKKARILLTTDPCDVLEFLGLSNDCLQWEEPFRSVDDLFDYITTCRLFWVRPVAEDDSEGDDNKSKSTSDSGQIDKSRLKANDRRRMKQRPVFRKFVEEFLPACREANRFTKRDATRDSVRMEAFELFPSSRTAYDARLSEWRKERQRQTLWRDVIKASIPDIPEEEDGIQRNAIWRSHISTALKKIVMQDDYSLGIRPLVPLVDACGMYNEDQVKRFVSDNWKKVGEIVWQKNPKLYAERLSKDVAQ
ncbi:hypothetical protein GGR54DRAFT_644194 [Hypoxylon sp. NC1633]|nr:hypothetical protein GGR54DRAFT_644194 [Hypoxylon sp. NC1633]